MPTVSAKRIRLPIDLSTSNLASDKLTGGTPFFWRGNDVSFEIGLFFGDTLLSVANLASITLTVKPKTDRTGTAIVSKTVYAPDFDDTLDQDTWDNDTKQHASVDLLPVQTNFAITGNESEYWLVVTALTTDGTPKVITLGTSILTVIEDGDDPSVVPDPGDPTYYTAAQADALFVRQPQSGDGDPNALGLTGASDGQMYRDTMGRGRWWWNATLQTWEP